MDAEDVRYLRRCIDLAREARAGGNEPFGSILVDAHGTVLAERANTTGTGDVTGHPELALAAWASVNLTPEQRAGATLYTSCESCAMCAGGQYWAGIGRLVFAVSGAQLVELVGASVPVLDLPSREVFARGNRRVEVEGPCEELLAEGLALFEGVWPTP